MMKSLARFSLRREILSISCDHEADSAVYPLCQMLGRKVRIALLPSLPKPIHQALEARLALFHLGHAN